MITAKLNLSAIDKSKIFVGQDGKKYLDIVLIDTPNSKYGDYMIVQSQTKEERAAGKKGNILGNGKTFVKGGSSQQSSSGFGQQDDLW